MCRNHRLVCNCGRSQANIMFKNHILPAAVISNLYCPGCSRGISFDPQYMLVDNDWVLEFDMELARVALERVRLETDCLTPEFLFDEGLASWNGFTPTELDQRLVERQRIVALAADDMQHYLKEMRRWGSERAQRLREAGWRKARHC